jgi:UDP-glucose 4-epimerase
MHMTDQGTILITGAAGFIGSNLAKVLLANSYKVVGVDNLSAGRIENIAEIREDPRFSLTIGVITDKQFVLETAKDGQCIVHLASRKIPKYGDALGTLLVNAEGTRNVLERARQCDAKVVFSSTSDVYGKNRSFDEESDIVLGLIHLLDAVLHTRQHRGEFRSAVVDHLAPDRFQDFRRAGRRTGDAQVH